MQGSVSAWLKSKDILVPDDWVSACIDFVKSESRNTSDLATLKKMVYEQWLLTDLADLEKAVLPSEIKNDKYVLKGTICVQINNLADASQPKYSQLQKIQKKENLNNFVTAETQYTQKPWEAKPSRMLMLELTDGIMRVSGMEYTAIPTLTEKLAPGTKVKIKGPVTCRRGVLMLGKSNIEILGGEVEDLIPTNSYEAILCKGLNRPIPTQSAAHGTQPSVRSEPSTSHTRNDPDAEMNEEDLDVLMADVDFEGEEAGKSHVAPSSVRSDWDRGKLNRAPPSVQQRQENRRPKMEAFQHDDSIDDLLLGIKEEKTATPQLAPSSVRSQWNRDESIRPPIVQSRPMSSKPKVEMMQRRDSIDDLLVGIDFEGEASASTSGQSKAKNGNSKSIKRENADDVIMIDSDLEDFLNDAESEEDSRHRPANAIAQKSSDSYQNVVHSRNKTGASGASLLTATPGVRPQSSNSYLRAQRAETSSSCQKLSTSRNTKAPLPVASKTNFHTDINTRYATNTSSNFSGLKPNLFPIEPTSTARRQVNQLYICEAKRRFSTTNEQSINISIKAVVITLLSKLKYDDSTGWSLGARICDGTEMLDVEFSNAVLEDLIGFTASEAEGVKRIGGVEDCNRLKEGIDNCRETIITMCHYMDVKMEKSGRNIVLHVKL